MKYFVTHRAGVLRHTPKLLMLSMLGFSVSAYSVVYDTPNVKDGLRFGTFVSINPEIKQVSDKFHYTMGDPALFGGNLEQVLANQDRKDSDERLRADGIYDGAVEIYASQRLTKKMELASSVYLYYTPESHRNYGALWGVSLNFGSFGEKGRLTIGDGWTRLPVRQTDVDNIVQNRGTNISATYTGIPDLTLTAYYMPSASSDVEDRRAYGWHKNYGASAKYEMDLSPRKKITLAAGATSGKSHQNPFYVDDVIEGKSYMTSVGYTHNDWSISVDYGQRENIYNGLWWSTLDSKVFGVKTSYEFTPRLTGTLSYAHRTDDNSKPVSIQYLIDNNRSVNEENVFAKVKKNRYKAQLDYQLYKGFTITGSIENQRTRNYVEEGEFSKRDRIQTSVGARFSF